jgi:hypothetical protein
MFCGLQGKEILYDLGRTIPVAGPNRLYDTSQNESQSFWPLIPHFNLIKSVNPKSQFQFPCCSILSMPPRFPCSLCRSAPALATLPEHPRPSSSTPSGITNVAAAMGLRRSSAGGTTGAPASHQDPSPRTAAPCCSCHSQPPSRLRCTSFTMTSLAAPGRDFLCLLCLLGATVRWCFREPNSNS